MDQHSSFVVFYTYDHADCFEFFVSSQQLTANTPSGSWPKSLTLLNTLALFQQCDHTPWKSVTLQLSVSNLDSTELYKFTYELVWKFANINNIRPHMEQE